MHSPSNHCTPPGSSHPNIHILNLTVSNELETQDVKPISQLQNSHSQTNGWYHNDCPFLHKVNGTNSESRLGVKTLKSNSCIKKRISSLAEQILNNETGKQNFAHRDKREKSQSVALGFVLRGLAFSHSN